jgi:hypothetical protein
MRKGDVIGSTIPGSHSPLSCEVPHTEADGILKEVPLALGSSNIYITIILADNTIDGG